MSGLAGGSNVRALYGIHQVTFYNRADRSFYGTLKVVDGSTFALASENVSLTGGSSKYPWAVEQGLISSELNLTFSEYPDFLFEVLLGKAPTRNAAEAAGFVGNYSNWCNTSIKDVANGISGVSATAADEADLKFGTYTMIATGAATFDLFLSTDVDLGRGTDGVILDDNLLIATGLDVSVGDAVVADYGLTFTKVGTPAFVTGDSAIFDVRGINSGSSEVVIGGLTDLIPEVGVIAVGEARGNGQKVSLDIFRVKGGGLPIGMTANEYSSGEVSMTAFQDSARNGVFSVTIIDD